MKRPPVLGILGGIASGKSVVARAFVGLGAVMLDADQVGHEVLRLPHVRQAVRERWGEPVMNASGEVDRKALAGIVFGPPPDGPAELLALERLTHPEIRTILEAQIAAIIEQRTAPAIILDAPVMLKAGWDRLCDKIVYVEAPREVRLSRARLRGWTPTEFDAREAAQEPVEEKRRLADFVIDNSGSLESTQAQVEALWQRLIR